MADVDHWTRWARDLGGIVDIAGVNGWVIAGDAGAVLRGSRQPARARVALLVGSEAGREAATEALRRTGQYRLSADAAPLNPTWGGWSRQVLGHGPEVPRPAPQTASAEVAVIAAPGGVARPVIDEARAHAVEGVPVASPAQLIALGALMPDGSAGSLTGLQTTELVVMVSGWRAPSEWFQWMASSLPAINQVTLGQAMWERYDVEQSRHYPGGERRFAELQRRAGFRVDDRTARDLPARIAALEVQAGRTPPARRVPILRQAQDARELQAMWASMTGAPGQWWRAYGSYSTEMGGAGLGRSSIAPLWGPGPRRTFLHTPPQSPGRGLGRS